MMEPVPIPSNPRRIHETDTDANRVKRERRKERGQSTRGSKGNVKQQRKSQHDRDYLAREIVAWDGEGVTIGKDHFYCLLSSSEGDRLIRREGLRSMDILDLVYDRARENPHALHVIYGGGYDFNSWIASLPRDLVERLAEDETVEYGPYLLTWRMGRFFRLKREGLVTTIYDVVPFFQCAFVRACDEYLGDRFVDRDNIVASKARRGDFTFEEITAIVEYNDSELVNLVELVRELRLRLWKVGIKPTQWYGPGAIAAAVLSEHGIQNKMHQHDVISHQERCAYSGGRFEVFKHGHFTGRTYQYDINSAYPSALRHVPSLVGTWKHRRAVDAEFRFPDFSLVHVEWEVSVGDRPGPLWVRRKDGVIYSPARGKGWYWGVEVNAARDYVDGIKCDEWYEYRPDDPSDKPFYFIDAMYNKRRALKAAGDGANVGLKLGLNSMYGKLAQQIGWREEFGELKLPPYHSMSWAGFTTAHCRANILRAIALDPDAIIATETDAVFSRRPLDLKVGTGLGEWDYTTWDELIYVQSGFYAGTAYKNGVAVNGEPVVKSRGIDKGTVTYDDVKRAVETGEPIRTRLTRYAGVRLAMAQGWKKWRRWETVDKEIKPTPQGKRLSVGFRQVGESFTRTIVPFEGQESVAYPVAWINPDDAAQHLVDIRRESYDDDFEDIY